MHRIPYQEEDETYGSLVYWFNVQNVWQVVYPFGATELTTAMGVIVVTAEKETQLTKWIGTISSET